MSGFSDRMNPSDDVHIKLNAVKQQQRKTLIGINTLANVDQWVYNSHMPFFFDLGRVRERTGDKFILFAPPRMSIDRMRNEAARIAMEEECTHLMFIDDDILLPDDSYQKLISHNKNIIGGLTFIRSYPFDPMIFDFKREDTYFMRDFRIRTNKEGLIECDALGFSCVLISINLIKKIPPPYFVTGVNHTEDVYFCKKVKELFPDEKIWIDSSVKTSHKIGSEFVDSSNVDFWKDYYEKFKKEEKNTGDRDISYLEENELEKI